MNLKLASRYEVYAGKVCVVNQYPCVNFLVPKLGVNSKRVNYN